MLKLLLALTLGARAAVTWNESGPVIKRRCGVCHRGPFLDLTQFPFAWSESKDQKVIAREMWRRIQLSGWGKMPPVNGQPLSASEERVIEAWIRDGLLP